MSFNKGFSKVATSFSAGLSAAGKENIGDALKLKGMRDAVSGLKKSHKGKYKELVKTPAGRGVLAEAVGKSLPSIAVGAGYATIGKKIYNKIQDQRQQALQQQYYNYYGQ